MPVQAYVSVDLQVEGNPEGLEANFDFTARVTCIAPDTGNYYAPAAGEVHCKLVWVKKYLPDQVIYETDCPSGGVTYLRNWTITEYTEFKVEAKHKQSGDEQVKRVACWPDGTWDEIPSY